MRRPQPPLFNERIEGVLAVVYGVFTEGYAATAGTCLVDAELCAEAIRLGRLLDELLPMNPGVLGLLALMLLHDARRRSRMSDERRCDPARGSRPVAVGSGQDP